MYKRKENTEILNIFVLLLITPH